MGFAHSDGTFFLTLIFYQDKFQIPKRLLYSSKEKAYFRGKDN